MRLLSISVPWSIQASISEGLPPAHPKLGTTKESEILLGMRKIESLHTEFSARAVLFGMTRLPAGSHSRSWCRLQGQYQLCAAVGDSPFPLRQAVILSCYREGTERSAPCGDESLPGKINSRSEALMDSTASVALLPFWVQIPFWGVFCWLVD